MHVCISILSIKEGEKKEKKGRGKEKRRGGEGKIFRRPLAGLTLIFAPFHQLFGFAGRKEKKKKGGYRAKKNRTIWPGTARRSSSGLPLTLKTSHQQKRKERRRKKKKRKEEKKQDREGN